MKELPPGWAWTTLGQVATPGRPKVSPATFPELPFIGMEHVEAQTMRLLGTVPAGELKSAAVHFQAGDVMYGRLRPYLNKVLRPAFEGLCSSEFIVFPPSLAMDQQYLQHILNSAPFVSFASHLNAGDRPRVDFEQIGTFELALPPSAEQRRIVAEIDRHFVDLANIDGILRNARARVDLLRHAVILQQLGQLSHQQTYPLCRFGDLIAEVGGGTTQPPIDERTDWPILRSSSVRTLGINWSDVRYLRVPPSAENAKLRSGDLLFTRLNGSIEYVANCAVVGDLGASSFFFPDRLFRVRLRDGVSPDYIALAFGSRTMRQQVSELTRSSAGHQRISISDLKRFTLPLPPHTAQVQIAEEASRILSVLSVLMTGVSDSLARAAHFRQAILQKAFEGKLVPQDPNNEPASVLLDRIRATRAQTPARRAPRKREVHA